MPAKSKHMERRKQRIANAKRNARLAGKARRRRRLQALFGLLAIAVLLTAGYLWMTGFFESEEPAEEAPPEAPTAEMTGIPTEEMSGLPSEEPVEPTEETTE